MNTSVASHLRNTVHPDLWSLATDRPAYHDAGRVLIAVATGDGVRVDCDFENAEEYLLYENYGSRTCFIGRQVCPRVSDMAGSLHRTELLADCDLVVCSSISDTCKQDLAESGVACNLAYAGARISEAVSTLLRGTGT